MMEADSLSSVELQALQDHPLYREGMDQIRTGKWQQATETFEILLGIYPDEPEAKRLLDEAQMRATLARFQPSRRSRVNKPQLIRRLAIGALAVVILAAAGYAVYEFWIGPVLLQDLRVRQVASLRENADQAIAAGNYAQARQSLQELQALLPQDPETAEALGRIEQVEQMAEMYADAQGLMASGQWNEALTVLTQLRNLDEQYRDLPQLLEMAKNSRQLDKQFQTAAEAFANGDWATAVIQFEALQQADLTFKFEEVQARIFESHLRHGQELVAETKGNPDQVIEALAHFSKALELRPLNDEALAERNLAETYLAILNAENQDQAVDMLKEIYHQQPEYAGNRAAQLLYTALSERAAASLAAGDKETAIADYQAAARLTIEDTTKAEQMLAELTSE